MRILIFLSLFLLASCEPTHESKTDLNDGELYTVNHDGHKWVIYRGSYKGGLEHHPDCEKCKKNKSRD